MYDYTYINIYLYLYIYTLVVYQFICIENGPNSNTLGNLINTVC